MWTVVSFPCVCLRLLQQHELRMGTSLLYVLVMVGTFLRLSKDAHHPKAAFPARLCGGACCLLHESCVLLVPLPLSNHYLFKRSQWANNLRRYDNHTYTHTHTHTHTHAHTHTNTQTQRNKQKNTQRTHTHNHNHVAPSPSHFRVIVVLLNGARKSFVNNYQRQHEKKRYACVWIWRDMGRIEID